MIMLKREPVREKSRLLMEVYMPFYVVFSEYQVPREKGEKIFPHHVAYMDQLQAQKRVLAAGPLTDGTGAMVILIAGSREEAEKILSDDPIHREGIRKFQIREWKPVRFFNWELGNEKT